MAKPLSIQSIRDKALQLRQDFDLSESAQFPIVEFVELILPQIMPGFIFLVETKEEMRNSHGLTLPEENCIKIREDVYENAIAGIGRDRFTVAHELGHYLLHQVQNIVLARTGNNKIEAFRNPEWQADTFAAELLMPINLIEGTDNKFSISERFGVSYKAAKVRLNKIR